MASVATKARIKALLDLAELQWLEEDSGAPVTAELWQEAFFPHLIGKTANRKWTRLLAALRRHCAGMWEHYKPDDETTCGAWVVHVFAHRAAIYDRIDEVQGTRLCCSVCAKMLPPICFHKASGTTRGFRYGCKLCAKIRTIRDPTYAERNREGSKRWRRGERYKALRERRLEQDKAYREKEEAKKKRYAYNRSPARRQAQRERNRLVKARERERKRLLLPRPEREVNRAPLPPTIEEG